MTISPRDRLLFDIFVTAMEGGIGYWSYCDEYHWMKPDATPEMSTMLAEDTQGFYAVITDEDDDRRHRIDREVVSRGLTLAATEWRDKVYWSSGDKPPLVVADDTDWDFDAGDADMIVQLGLLGEVRYG